VPRRTYRSEIAASVHETMEGLSRIGLIGAATMSEFDKSCLAPAILAGPATRSSDS
jgi:putative transcriptional regulator